MERLELVGDGAARGEAHGEQARDRIHEAIARWQRDVGAGWESHLVTLVETSGFRATAQRLTPDLVAEVDGIARGADADPRLVWALNLMDEDWWLRSASAAGEACSGFGVQPREGQPAIIGQNMDLPSWLDGLQVLLDIRPDDGPRVLAPAYAGMVATNALNECGVGVCVNTLPLLPKDPAGLPVAFVIRAIAHQATFAEAVKVLRSTPHASGQNYIVGASEGIVDFECGAGSLVDVTGRDAWVTHTNHSLGDEVDAAGAGFVANSALRLDTLRDRIAASGGPFDAADLAAVLREPPLCRGNADGGMTFYSVVMTLTATPTLSITDGPPSTHPALTHGFA